MKRFSIPILICLNILMTIVMAQVSAAEKTHFKVGTYERTLFREKDANGVWHGLDIDIIRETFNRTAYTFELVEMPWQRNLLSLRNGSVDIALSAAPLEERKAYAYFSAEPFRLGHNALYIEKAKAAKFSKVKTLADLKNTDLRIGVLRGVSYSDEFESLSEQAWFHQHLVIIDDQERLPDMVLLGRIDGFLDSAYEGQRRIQNYPAAKAKILRYRLVTSHEEAVTYLMFSKVSVTPDAVEKINTALSEFVSEGGYNKLLTDYHLEDVEKIN